MIAGVNAVMDTKEQDEIMIVGLGGGGLCMFLHHCFPKVNIFLSFLHALIRYYQIIKRRIEIRVLLSSHGDNSI